MADRSSLTPRTAPLEAARERIGKSAAIAVVLPDAPGLPIIGSAVALASGLRAIGKTVSVFAPPTLPSPWLASSAAGAEDDPLREFVISFDLTRSPVKELRYERAKERLDIILSPTAGRIRREDVEFRYGALNYDLVLTLGVERPEAASASLRKAPELLLSKPILNIDANPRNTGYGEVNLITEYTLPEAAHELLSLLGVPSDAERASALLSALAAATANFKPPRASSSAFLLAGKLLGEGGEVVPLVPPQRSLASAQLAARAMLRTRIDDERRALVALLTPDDFSKTAALPEAAAALEHLAEAVPGLERYLLAWQWAPDRPVRVSLLSRQEAGGPAIGAAERDFQSFEDARAHIARLLGEGGAVQ